MITKVCGTCREEKPATAFAKNIRKSLGLSFYCKACESKRYRSEKTRKYKAAYRERIRNSEHARQKRHEAYLIQKEAHPERIRARALFRYEVKMGRIAKPDRCEACGVVNPKLRNGRIGVEAHHYLGYDRPFDVKFLCVMCHIKAERGEIDLV